MKKMKKVDINISFLGIAFHTVLILCLGLVIGVVAKLLDIYTTNLGNIFSQMSVWIFLCTLISVCSRSAKRASVNVLCFCAGMLLTYYITAYLTASAYSLLFVCGWAVFACFSPLLAFCVWYARGKGRISKPIAGCITIAILVTAFILFDKIRITDVIFAILTSVFLFKDRGAYKPKGKRGVPCERF